MQMKSLADWDQWVILFRENPEEFERERQAAIEELIMNQPADLRHRSRQLQWRIDAVRRRAPNSLASCIRIYDMLMDSVYGPGGLIDVINGGAVLTKTRLGTGKPRSGICVKLEKPAGKNSGH